jgi:hypothetical protein
MSVARFVISGFVIGVYLNLAGWLGNVFVLGDAWDEAYEMITISLSPPYPALAKELLTFVSDFVYGFVLLWLFLKSAVERQASTRYAFALVSAVWLSTVGVTYLALVNSGFLPISIAWKTGLWALLTFLPLGFILPSLRTPHP